MEIFDRYYKQEASMVKDRDDWIYYLLFRRMSDAVFIIENNSIIRCNQAALKMFGCMNEEEIIGLNFSEISPPEQSDGLDSRTKGKHLMEEVMEKGIIKFEWIHERMNGNLFPAEVAFIRMTMEDKCIVAAIIQDSTKWREISSRIEESERKYRSLFEDNHAVMLLIDPKSGNIIDANSPACKYYGYEKEKLTKLKITDINILNLQQVHREMEKAKEEKRKHFYFKHLLANGQIRDVEVYSGPIEINGRKVLYSMVHDITERSLFENELKLQKSYFQQLFINSPEAITILDNEWKIMDTNIAFEKLFQYKIHEIIGKSIKEMIYPANNEGEFLDLLDLIEKGNTVKKQVVRRNKEGKLIDLEMLAYPIINNGEKVGMYAIYNDITERKRKEEMIEFLAVRDSLTRLYNRSYFIDKLDNEIIKSSKNKKSLMVMFLDLEGFKRINDNLGHFAGDRVLQTFARRLEKCVGQDNTIARIGGDDFIILFPAVNDVQRVVKVADAIVESFNEPFSIKGTSLYLSVSIGLSIYPDDGLDGIRLIRNADMAMYNAKKKKKRIEFYSPVFYEQVKKNFILESQLENLLDKDQLVLNYQPILDIHTNKILGIETLVRWYHPQLRVISPLKFIPIAENNGMIVPIGEWILRNACRQNKKWQDLGYGPFFISVNISIKQLEQHNFPGVVKQILMETGLSPQYLELEISEIVYMENIDRIFSVLKELTDVGVKISIDDYGTGYSSLSQLKRVNISRLKMDGSFIQQIGKDCNSTQIVSATIAMSKSLDMVIVAEGVETREQYLFLKEQGCDMVQGFLFSKPISTEGMETLLESNVSIPKDMKRG